MSQPRRGGGGVALYKMAAAARAALPSAGVSGAANLLAFVTLRLVYVATHTHTHSLRHTHIEFALHQLYANFPNARIFLSIFHSQAEQSCKTLT